jgi:hypothetical protein
LFDYGDQYDWKGQLVEDGHRDGVDARIRDDAGWKSQLVKLKMYKRKRGDCNVPQRWAEDPRLARWVNTQRQGKRALDRGAPWSGMTAARVTRLEALGFVWEPAAASWEAKLAKLEAYKHRHGDCNVPQGWAEDPPLGGWVQNQRKLKKKLDCGNPSLGMTAARVAKLEALGFAWTLRGAGWPSDDALLGFPTPSESRIIKEKAAAKNQKRKSQNRSDSKAASKRSREASSRGDVTFDDASAGRAEDTAIG